RAAVVAVSVRDPEIHAVRILHVEGAIVVALVFRDRVETARLERCLDLLFVPGGDAPRETVPGSAAAVDERHAGRLAGRKLHSAATACSAGRATTPGAAATTAARRVARGATTTAASTAAAAATRAASRRGVATADLHAAEVTHVHHDDVAVVATHFPAEERRVEGRFLLGIGDVHREMVEQHGLPSRGVERRLHRRVSARRARVSVATGTAALTDRAGERRRDGGEPQYLKELPARYGAAIVSAEQAGKLVHERTPGG